jgi:hypothetical protein
MLSPRTVIERERAGAGARASPSTSPEPATPWLPRRRKRRRTSHQRAKYLGWGCRVRRRRSFVGRFVSQNNPDLCCCVSHPSVLVHGSRGGDCRRSVDRQIFGVVLGPVLVVLDLELFPLFPLLPCSTTRLPTARLPIFLLRPRASSPALPCRRSPSA